MPIMGSFQRSPWKWLDYGSVAPSHLDLSVHLRSYFFVVSGIVPAGIRLGAAVDFLNDPKFDRKTGTHGPFCAPSTKSISWPFGTNCLQKNSRPWLLRFWRLIWRDSTRSTTAKSISRIGLSLPGGQSPLQRSVSKSRPALSHQAAIARGIEALRAGQVGVLITAGGQGTRLGFNLPKSLYKIGPLSGGEFVADPH